MALVPKILRNSPTGTSEVDFGGPASSKAWVDGVMTIANLTASDADAYVGINNAGSGGSLAAEDYIMKNTVVTAAKTIQIPIKTMNGDNNDYLRVQTDTANAFAFVFHYFEKDI